MTLVCSVVVLCAALPAGLMHASRQRQDRQSRYQQQLLLKALRDFV